MASDEERTQLFKVIRTAIDQADHANPASFDTMASHIEFAVNNFFSDSANEAEKDARRKVAVMQIATMRHWDAEQLDAIIQKAQG
jgi:hypothetical protein